MKFLPANQITLSQLFFFMLHAQIGLSVLSLPHDLSNNVGHDGWISVIVSAIFVQLLLFLYYYLMKQYPDKTFYEVTQVVFGAFVGKALNYIIILYYLVYSAHFAYQCTHILKIWNYYNTPFWVIAFLLIFIVFYIVNSDLSPIGRFLIIASVVILLMVYSQFWDINELNYHYLLPIGEANIWDIISDSKIGFVAFAGFEIFMFIHPFTQSTKKKKLKIASICIWIVCFLYVKTIMLVYMYFPDAARSIDDPSIYYIIPMHFTVIERIEVFFLASWTILVVSSQICFLYLGLLGLSRMRNKEHHNHYAKPVSLLTFIFVAVAHLFANEQMLSTFKHFLMYCTILVVAVIPIITVVVNLLKEKKQKGVAKNDT